MYADYGSRGAPADWPARDGDSALQWCGSSPRDADVRVVLARQVWGEGDSQAQRWGRGWQKFLFYFLFIYLFIYFFWWFWGVLVLNLFHVLYLGYTFNFHG